MPVLTTTNVPTSALREGDRVLNHGMILLLTEPLNLSRSHPASIGPVYFTEALITNMDEITDPFIRGMSRIHGTTDDRWGIQGNDLARWALITEETA